MAIRKIKLGKSMRSIINKLPKSNSPYSELKSAQAGFTIVELLVVIVVIGILAAITIVSYAGISDRAKTATIQADLSNASKQIKLFQATSPTEDYPTANNCPTPGATEICLKSSGSNSFAGGYTVNNTTNPKTFTLDATNGTTVYRITENTAPVAVTTIPITAIAATTGTTNVIGNAMTAGALSPGVATASYQWQSAITAGGTYTSIAGATNNTYTLKISDVGKYLKVVATGTGSYGGSQASVATAQISDANWLAVGSQVWAKANLNVGISIGVASNQTNNATLEKYCWGQVESMCTDNGGLYQWNEAMQYVTAEGARGICPINSHIPSDNEWTILTTYLGGESTAGTQLKVGGTSGLNMPLAGLRGPNQVFYYFAENAYFWSSSESGSDVWIRSLNMSSASVGRSALVKDYGFSVRCIGN